MQARICCFIVDISRTKPWMLLSHGQSCLLFVFFSLYFKHFPYVWSIIGFSRAPQQHPSSVSISRHCNKCCWRKPTTCDGRIFKGAIWDSTRRYNQYGRCWWLNTFIHCTLLVLDFTCLLVVLPCYAVLAKGCKSLCAQSTFLVLSIIAIDLSVT